MVSFKEERKEIRPLGTDRLLWALYQLIHHLLWRGEPLTPQGATRGSWGSWDEAEHGQHGSRHTAGVCHLTRTAQSGGSGLELHSNLDFSRSLRAQQEAADPASGSLSHPAMTPSSTVMLGKGVL